MESLKDALLALLQVPPRPHPPAGAAGSLRVFRAAQPYLYYRLAGWTLRQAGVLAGIAAAIAFTQGGFSSDWIGNIPVAPVRSMLEFVFSGEIGLFGALELLALSAFLIQLPFSFLLVFLDYEYRWYMVTDRSLRIREGVWKILEQTMTFSNVQNVTVRQGPVERLFGISEVEVRTAGGGGSEGEGQKQSEGLGRNLHLAHFRGVDNPREIRDLVLAHLRRIKASGLGDPDEPERPTQAEDALAAARELLTEARLLRHSSAQAMR